MRTYIIRDEDYFNSALKFRGKGRVCVGHPCGLSVDSPLYSKRM